MAPRRVGKPTTGPRIGWTGGAGRLLRRLNDPADWGAFCIVSALLCCGEAVLCALIIWKVPYTEIDWVTYMAQAAGFASGERDYANIGGPTGPCVYPALHLYIYAGLRAATGGALLPAQALFAGLYVAALAVACAITAATRTAPPWALVLLCLSKRLHSLFVLRLFNDCIASSLAYVAVLLLQRRKWRWGLLAFSAGVGVKMSVLLMAPPLLLLLLKGPGVRTAVEAIAGAALVQLALGWPFLAAHPGAYLARSFDLGRKFLYVWTVNFRFLPEPVFLSRAWAAVLLGAHLGLLGLFADRVWCAQEGGLRAALAAAWRWGGPGARPARVTASESVSETEIATAAHARHVAEVMLTGNLIGILTARTLHYQFYSWYAHSLPLLLWCAPLPTAARLALIATIEACWLTYPATAASSLVLLACHVILLVGLYVGGRAAAGPSKPATRHKLT